MFPQRIAAIQFLRARYAATELAANVTLARTAKGTEAEVETNKRLELAYKQAETIGKATCPLLITPQGKSIFADMDRMARALTAAADMLQAKLDGNSYQDSHMTAMIAVHRLAHITSQEPSQSRWRNKPGGAGWSCTDKRCWTGRFSL